MVGNGHEEERPAERKGTLRLVALARKKAELLAVLATDIPTYGLALEEARELVDISHSWNGVPCSGCNSHLLIALTDRTAIFSTMLDSLDA